MPLETSYWPIELLELLFTFVAEDAALNGDGLLTTLLCVCSTWRDIGTRVIWTNISLNPEKLARFTGSTSGSTYHSLVRSLTLSIPHIKPALTPAWYHADGASPVQGYLEDPSNLASRGNNGTRRLWENLSKLAIILPRMTSMTSFSFYVTEQSSEFRSDLYGFWLRRSDLQAILEALPKTVTDLEVDTKGFDQFYIHDKHLCPQIASLVSKCKNIRIRLSRMCTEIIPTNVDNKQLESVVISLLSPDHLAATKDCGMIPDGDRSMDTTSLVVERCTMLRQCLTFKLDLFKQDCPYLKCLRLIESVGGSPTPKPGFRTINIRDFLSGNTSSYPLWLLPPTLLVDTYALRTMKEGSCQDSCGKFEDLEQTIEGSPWVETMAGNRLALNNASSHAQRQFKLKDFTLEEPSVYQARSGISCELWDMERRAGRTLLFTREVEGFPDVEVLEREILEDEGSEESQSDDGEGSVWLFDFDDDLGDEDPSLGHPWQ